MTLPSRPLTTDPWQRGKANLRGGLVSAWLLSTVLCMNVIQTASLFIRPVSIRRFRAVNRWAAGTWWGLCVRVARQTNGFQFELRGDHLPQDDNALIVCNHQSMADIPVLLCLAATRQRLGDVKWFVKDAVKWVPGIGWGMLFLDCVFLKRDWASDQRGIERTFGGLKRGNVPMWLISFSEGSRITAAKAERGRAFARKSGLPITEHVAIPRKKGFVATVKGLREHVQAVYDVTIAYTDGVPSMWQFLCGESRGCVLHVTRHAMDGLPEADDALGTWLIDRFVAKDGWLDGFATEGLGDVAASVHPQYLSANEDQRL